MPASAKRLAATAPVGPAQMNRTSGVGWARLGIGWARAPGRRAMQADWRACAGECLAMPTQSSDFERTHTLEKSKTVTEPLIDTNAHESPRAQSSCHREVISVKIFADWIQRMSESLFVLNSCRFVVEDSLHLGFGHKRLRHGQRAMDPAARRAAPWGDAAGNRGRG